MDREREVQGVACAEEAGQDEYTFGVNRAAHLHLALDFHHLSLADAAPGRDGFCRKVYLVSPCDNISATIQTTLAKI